MSTIYIYFEVREDNLERAVFTLVNIGKNYNFKLSKSKTKLIAPQGKDSIGTKIILENKWIVQIHLHSNTSTELYKERYEAQGKIQV